MAVRSSARDILRTATAEAHARVDQSFGTFELGDRAGYAEFLRAQAASFLPVEAALDRAGATDLLPDWPERRRAQLLQSDLSAMGVAAHDSDTRVAFGSSAAMLGAIYVLEGSRLGGRMLARAVPPEFPQLFLAAGSSTLWRRLISVLDKQLVSPDDQAEAIAAARQVFALFERGAAMTVGSKLD